MVTVLLMYLIWCLFHVMQYKLVVSLNKGLVSDTDNLCRWSTNENVAVQY